MSKPRRLSLRTVLAGDDAELGVSVVRMPSPPPLDQILVCYDGHALTSSDCAEDRFPYAELQPSVLEKLRSLEHSINARRVLEILQDGQDLLEAKKLFAEHKIRLWGVWLQVAFGWSESHARNCMDAATWFKESATVALLSPTAMYAGARAPAPVRLDILERRESGHALDKDQIVQMRVDYDRDHIDTIEVKERKWYERRLSRSSRQPATPSELAVEFMDRLSTKFDPAEIVALIDMLPQIKIAELVALAKG